MLMSQKRSDIRDAIDRMFPYTFDGGEPAANESRRAAR